MLGSQGTPNGCDFDEWPEKDMAMGGQFEVF